MAPDEGIIAHLAHRHRAGLLPAEHLAEKRECPIGIVALQIIPAEMLRLFVIEHVALGVGIIGRRSWCHDVERRALPVGNERHAAHTLHRPVEMHGAACRHERLLCRIDVGDVHIAVPRGPGAAVQHFP